MSNVFSAVVRLAADPEKRDIKDGLSTVEFRAANNVRGKNEHTNWLQCNVWNDKLGQLVLSACFKGSRVFVSGVLTTQEWEKDGTKYFKLLLRVDQLELLDPKKKDEDPVNTSDSQQSTTAPKTKKKNEF